MKKSKSTLGSKRSHYKHYRAPAFTDEKDYYQLDKDGKKIPLNDKDLRFLRKFQWNELSNANRKSLSKEDKQKQDHDLYVKRFDALNVTDDFADNQAYVIDSVATAKKNETPSLDELTLKDALLEAVVNKDKASFMKILDESGVSEANKILASKGFDRKTKPKQRYQKGRNYIAPKHRPLTKNTK